MTHEVTLNLFLMAEDAAHAEHFVGLLLVIPRKFLAPGLLLAEMTLVKGLHIFRLLLIFALVST